MAQAGSSSRSRNMEVLVCKSAVSCLHQPYWAVPAHGQDWQSHVNKSRPFHPNQLLWGRFVGWAVNQPKTSQLPNLASTLPCRYPKGMVLWETTWSGACSPRRHGKRDRGISSHFLYGRTVAWTKALQKIAQVSGEKEPEQKVEPRRPKDWKASRSGMAIYGDRSKDCRPMPGGQATEAQEAALSRLWEQLKIFMDEKDKGGVPRTPSEEWKRTISSLSITYTGEVIEKASMLTLKQVLPGLPSPEHGGLVNIMEILPPELAEELKDPSKLIKAEFPDPMPRPKVMCEDQEWDHIVKALYERGIVKPAKTMPSIHGKRAVNGAFGVPKAGKFLPTGEEVLRLIIDLRVTNWMMRQIEGDTATLTGAATFQRIVIEEGSQLLVSGEDLTAAFYLFKGGFNLCFRSSTASSVSASPSTMVCPFPFGPGLFPFSPFRLASASWAAASFGGCPSS